VGKAARRTARGLRRGDGTAIPAVAALAIDSGLLAGLAAEIPHGSVTVTGTNGKSTTCRMLAAMMRASGLHPVPSHESSRQPAGPAGLVTALLAGAAASGHLSADDRVIGLFEVEEGSLPQILPQVKPATAVFTNAFRDQRDDHLEPDDLTRRWEQCLRGLADDTTLVLNADDPRVACLASECGNPRIWYGLEDTAHRRSGTDPTSDYPRCPRCTGGLRYRCVFYAHLGHWECGDCGLARPAPQVHAAKIDLIGAASARLQVVTPGSEAVLEVPLPGLYNVYNTVAAAAAAAACQLSSGALTAVGNVTSGFCGWQPVSLGSREVHFALVKNAIGCTEVLRALLGDGQPRHMLLALSDPPGDQQPEVSWIWDVDFESLPGLVPSAVLSGSRADDLAVRLKYARWPGAAAGEEGSRTTVEPDPVRAFQLALAAAPAGEPVWVVSTHPALRRLRKWLIRRGCVSAAWGR